MATAAPESDLERDLRDVGDKLSSPPSDAEELLSLLNLAENILWRVKQRPSNSICGALHLIMKALVTEDLMNHSEMDVKVALASCFSEIIRISAPADPYCENLMKAILQIIVDALTGIDDLSSCSHGKRVSILETITETHAFFMLLDLECDDLILVMFHRFLKTARQVNDGRVLAFMETMMTKLLSESEDILLSRLLDCIVKDIKDHLPIPSRLGEKVIGNCADKLRPHLIKLVRSNGDSCNYYGDIIASICQENSDTSDPNKPSTSGECLIFQEETCHMQGPDDELDRKLLETSSVPRNKFLETNTIFQEEACHMQVPDDELAHQLPETNSAPEDTFLETNMIFREETCYMQEPVDELDQQNPEETNSVQEDILLKTNMEETCHMQGLDNELDNQLSVINSAPEDKLLETNMIFQEETCHMQGPDDELDHQLSDTNSTPEDKLLETNMILPEETCHMQGSDNELDHQLPVINSAPEDKLLETNMEETCHMQGPDDELDHQLSETNSMPEDKLLETNKIFQEETCHMQGPDDELDHQLLDTNSAPKDKLLERNMITLVQKGSFLIQGPVDVPDHLLLETNSKPEHKLGETNMEYDNQLSEGTYFHELPQKSGRLEQEVNCPNNSEAEKAFQETTRRSSRKIVKRKFFEEENCRTMKQKKNTKKIDLPTKKILKKCGETWTSKSTRKLNKIELSVLQKSIIEKLTGELLIIDDLVGEQSSKVLWRCYCPGL